MMRAKFKNIFKAMYKTNFFLGIIVFIKYIYLFISSSLKPDYLFDLLCIVILIVSSLPHFMDIFLKRMYPEGTTPMEYSDESLKDIAKFIFFLLLLIFWSIFLLHYLF